MLFVQEFKRLWFVLVMLIASYYFFVSGYYETLPAPIQLVMLKAFLVFCGVIVAHIIRKAFFPKVDWNNDKNWQLSLMVIALYIVIPYSFAVGG